MKVYSSLIKILAHFTVKWFGSHLDFAGDVVLHIFFPQQRAYYNLEEFYGNATLVELPFETHMTRQGWHFDLYVFCQAIPDEMLPLFSLHSIHIIPDVKASLRVKMR